MDESNNIGSLELNIGGECFHNIKTNGIYSESVTKGSHKSISEDNHIEEDATITPSADTLPGSKESLKDIKMVQNGESLNDGADEKMLSNEDKQRLAKKEEVKFISGDQQNGDAKIDIGTLEKVFTGMNKEELMKYANDPFWVRLRWIFFILFWALWVAMLVGAILIIINAPKCAAPTPLVWWKQGPLINMKSSKISNNDLEQAEKGKAKGVIYQLPAEDTYSVTNAEVEGRIKKIVEYYKEKNINVILDLTPNYVSNESPMFKEALRDKSHQAAFIWETTPEVPNNWYSIINGSAWTEILPQNFVLSQFGDNKYDLHMNSSLVKEEFKGVLKHLVKLGVKGFRLSNAKHFILNKDLKNEIPADEPGYIHTQYGFWTHTQTTFQEGLGSYFHELKLFVKNATENDVFLSVTDDLIRPEVFQLKSGEYGIDLPIYGRLPHTLAAQGRPVHKDLLSELRNTFDIAGNTTWLQWNYELDNLGSLDSSSYNMFFMLLPGVPVQPANTSLFKNVSDHIINQLEMYRKSSSYMHGTFALYNSGEVLAYTRERIKSGNPGFFVVLNPTDSNVVANFSSTGLPDKMTIDLLSDNYNSTDIAIKTKVFSNSIALSPYSAAILTYVPVK